MHELPLPVQDLIDTLLEGVSGRVLQENVEALSARYSGYKAQVEQIHEHLAYLVCRMPATFAAVSQAFWYLKERYASFSPVTHADFGAGPATAFFAACEAFPSLQKSHLIERDSAFINLGKKLIDALGSSCTTTWEQNLALEVKHSAYDLVTSSYMLSEMKEDARDAVVEKMWQQTSNCLVLVETGTPKGYATVIQARDLLLKKGAFLVAPCPHHMSCPMLHSDRWCHFSVRLARSRAHRLMKRAERGFEDEKYCYLVASKHALEMPACNRVVATPGQHSGHVQLTLCTFEGQLAQTTVSRRSKEAYRVAKKLDWGDIYTQP